MCQQVCTLVFFLTTSADLRNRFPELQGLQMHFGCSLSHVKQPAGLEPDDKCLRYNQTNWKAFYVLDS